MHLAMAHTSHLALAIQGDPEKVEHHPARIPDMGYPKKMERRKGDRLRVHGVG